MTARKKDKAKASEAPAHEAALLAQEEAIAHMGSWRMVLETGRVTWSDEMYNIFGLDRTTFSHDASEAIALAVHPEDRAKLDELNSAVLRDGIPRPMDYRIVHPDGTVRWVHAQGEQERDETGKVVALTGFVLDITERKQAEDALRESEEKYREMADMLPQTVFELDINGKFTYANRHGFDQSGFTKEDIENGLNALELFIPEERQRVMTNLGKILGGELLGPNEYTALKKDGSTYPALIYTRPIVKDAKTVGFRGLVIDITERKRAEEELYSLAKFPSENPNPVLRLNKDGIILYANESSRALLDDWRCEVGGRIPERWRDLVRDALKSKLQRTLDIKIGERVYEFIFMPVTNDGYANTYGRDITERKQAEEALQVKDWAIESAINAIAISDLAGNLTYVNPSFIKMWGYSSPAEVLYKSSAEFWQMSENAVEVIEALRARGNWFGEMVGYRKDGSLFDVQVAASLVVNTDGQPICMQASFADITERKRAEEQLKVSLIKYQVLFDSFPLGITISDKAGNIKESNKAAERLLELSTDEHNIRQIDGKEWHIIRKDGSPMPPDEYASVRALKEKHLVENVEMGIVKGTGDITWINVTAAPIPLEDYGVAIAYGDITERKQAEEALRKTEEKFRTVIENIFKFVPESLVVLTDKLNLFRRNKAFEDLVRRYAVKLNYSEEELADMLIEQIKTKLVTGEKSEIRIHRNHT